MISYSTYSDYVPQIHTPDDFRRFWLEGIGEDLSIAPQLNLTPLDYPIQSVELFDVGLTAGDGITLKGSYMRPRGISNIPALVRYHGYSGSRGELADLLLWALQGYAVLAMDIRGQGGQSPDGRVYPQGQSAGWLTLGLSDPQTYYYRQVYLDALRTVIALAGQPEVDPGKIGLTGKSQGGGLALITGGLLVLAEQEIGSRLGKDMNLHVRAITAAIPFLCDFPLAYRLATDGPLLELSLYFRQFDPEHKTAEQVFRCLNYFDAINFVPWVKSSVLMAVGLKDNVCPPQTVFGTYNLIRSPKELLVYPDYGHESIDPFTDRQIEFLAAKLLDHSP